MTRIAKHIQAAITAGTDSATKAAWLRVARLCSFRSKQGTTLALCVLVFVVLYLTSSQDLAFASIAYLGSTVDNTNYRAFLALVGLALIASTYKQCRRPFRSKAMLRST